jgi:hypothetical protein
MNFRKPRGSRRISRHSGSGRASGNGNGTSTAAVGELELSNQLRAGNRFGQAGVLLAVLALLCAMIGELEPAAWAFAPVGMLLAGAGFVLWCRDAATNVADAIVGFLLAQCVFLWLLCKLSLQYPVPPIMYPVT